MKDLDINYQANEAALLNIIMYLDVQDVFVYNKDKMPKVIDKLGTIYGSDSPNGYEKYIESLEGRGKEGSEEDYEERQRQYQILANASADKKYAHFASLRIDNQSYLMKDPDYNEIGLNACTFTDSNGNVQVAYRGTGSGEWIDNGIAISGTVDESRQQREAVEYFDRIVKLNEYDKNNTRIEISGHSKGGNKAQFVTINSQYNYLIDKCYNFDGQGMSPEAIKAFKDKYGEAAYLESVNKMYGFYSENDFVHPLGIPIIPESHRTYFTPTIEKNGIADNKKYHYADDYLNLDGSFSEETEQGYLSKLVESFSLQACDLPPALRIRVTSAFMGLMQGNRETINGESVSKLDYIIGGAIALKLLKEELSSPEGQATLNDLGGDLLVTVREKFGAIPELGAAGIMAIISPSLFADDLKNVLVKDFKAVVGFAIDNMIKLSNLVIDTLKKCGDKLLGIAHDIGDALCRFADEAKKTWVRVQNNITRLYSNVINTGKAIVVTVDSFIDKAIAAVSSFLKSVANGVKNFFSMLVCEIKNTIRKATQGVKIVIAKTKSEIRERFNDFKKGISYLASYSKKTLENLGEKGIAVLKQFGKKVVKVIHASSVSRLSVNLFQLEELQNKLRKLESYFDDQINLILREAKNVTSDVDRKYNESNVQRQIRNVYSSCEQVKTNGRRLCDALQRRINSLKYALEQYQSQERLLCKEVRINLFGG